MRNYLCREAIGLQYRDFLPGFENLRRMNFKERFVYPLDRVLNSYKPENMPKISPETEDMLATYLRRRNQGLDELIEVDLSKIWKTFT